MYYHINSVSSILTSPHKHPPTPCAKSAATPWPAPFRHCHPHNSPFPGTNLLQSKKSIKLFCRESRLLNAGNASRSEVATDAADIPTYCPYDDFITNLNTTRSALRNTGFKKLSSHENTIKKKDGMQKLGERLAICSVVAQFDDALAHRLMNQAPEGLLAAAQRVSDE
jgi:hypothetical protein